MEFYNRRLLLLNEDMPSSTISPLPLLQDNKPSLTATLANSSSPPMASTTSSSASEYRKPLQMPPCPALDSNIAYTMLVLLNVLFVLGFISIYIRRFSDEDSGSSRRRPHRNRPSTPSSWNYYSSSPCHNHKGADRPTVQSLPVYMYHGGGRHQIDCAICLSEFEEGEKVKMIPCCRHVFHVECIDLWLFSNVSCPICWCTKLFPAAERGGDGGGPTVENGGRSGREGEVGSHSERRECSRCGLEDRRQVLRRTLSY